jgi:RecA-family ATPase
MKYNLTTKSINDILEDTTTAPPAIIDNGILLENTVLLIFGKPKTRKTFLSNNLAIAIAQGQSFSVFRIPNPRRVVHLSAEGGYYSMRDRIKQMYRSVSTQVQNNLDICFNAQLILNNDEELTKLEGLLKEKRTEVLIMDPFVRFHNLDENSSTDMTEVLRRIRRLIEELNISVILVHHTGKAEGANARGSSAITGDYDSAIQITTTGDSLVHEFSFDMRHVETPDPIEVKFNPETLWFEQTEIDPVEKAFAELGSDKMKREYVKYLRDNFAIPQSTAYRLLEGRLTKPATILAEIPPASMN